MLFTQKFGSSAFSVLSNKTIEKGIVSSTHRRAFQHMGEILEEVKALYAVPRKFFARRVELPSTENAEEPRDCVRAELSWQGIVNLNKMEYALNGNLSFVLTKG